MGRTFLAITQNKPHQSNAAMKTCHGMLALRSRCSGDGGRYQYRKIILQSLDNIIISLPTDAMSDTMKVAHVLKKCCHDHHMYN